LPLAAAGGLRARVHVVSVAIAAISIGIAIGFAAFRGVDLRNAVGRDHF
jgi:hypothetical protein